MQGPVLAGWPRRPRRPRRALGGKTKLASRGAALRCLACPRMMINFVEMLMQQAWRLAPGSVLWSTMPHSRTAAWVAARRRGDGIQRAARCSAQIYWATQPACHRGGMFQLLTGASWGKGRRAPATMDCPLPLASPALEHRSRRACRIQYIRALQPHKRSLQRANIPQSPSRARGGAAPLHQASGPPGGTFTHTRTAQQRCLSTAPRRRAWLPPPRCRPATALDLRTWRPTSGPHLRRECTGCASGSHQKCKPVKAPGTPNVAACTPEVAAIAPSLPDLQQVSSQPRAAARLSLAATCRAHLKILTSRQPGAAASL